MATATAQQVSVDRDVLIEAVTTIYAVCDVLAAQHGDYYQPQIHLARQGAKLETYVPDAHAMEKADRVRVT